MTEEGTSANERQGAESWSKYKGQIALSYSRIVWGNKQIEQLSVLIVTA